MTTRSIPVKPGRPLILTGVVALALAGSVGGVAAWLQADPRAEPAARATASAFVAAPYLQPGDVETTYVLRWQTRDGAEDDGPWAVEARAEPDGPWQPADAPEWRRLDVDGPIPYRLHRAGLSLKGLGLKPGKPFDYRVKRAGAVVFQAAARALPAAGGPQRFVVFGDCAAATTAQRSVAARVAEAKPDYVVVTGDVVYARGRVSEYLNHFFDVYNADSASDTVGAPLMRSTVVFAAPGNHDLMEGNLDRYPDGLAFFYYWEQPRNGPVASADAPGAALVKAPAGRVRAFLDAAGPAYPRGAMFSFDVGDVHWTVLDSNPYVDWTEPSLRRWLEADLASPRARAAAWRVVAFHHTVFHSGKAHAEDQRMRLLAPAFEAGRVDVVFSGHVHNYQRTFPLKFAPGPPPADGRGKPFGPNGQVAGKWTLDRAYDGRTRTRPNGVVYVVTGAGGANLYNTTLGAAPQDWQPYTAKAVTDVHSLTVVDAEPRSLTLRQVADDGREVDRFVISRE